MRSHAYLLIAAVALAACGSDLAAPAGDGPQMSRAETYMENFKYDDTGFFRAQVNCTGEDVAWELHLHIVYRYTIDANGGFHGKFLFHDQGSSGVGLTTGRQYRLAQTQAEHVSFHADELPYTGTAVFSRRFITQGSLENFRVHNLFHITIDRDGNVTSLRNTVSRICD